MKIELILKNYHDKIMTSGDVRSLNILLEGDPSSGKTYLSEKFAIDRNLPFVSLSMPTLIVEKATGIPYRQGDTVKDSVPSWIRELGHNGVLVLDEFNCADDDIQKIFLSLLSDRRINDHKIGDKVMIIACQNEYRQANNYKMSPAVLNRFAKFNVEFDYTDWRNNYLPSKLNEYALKLLDNLVQNGFRFSKGEDFVNKEVCTTARSVERWLLCASKENKDFLIQDAYANLCDHNCVLVEEFFNSLKDVEDTSNTIFDATASTNYYVHPLSKGKKKIIYEIECQK